MKIQLKSLKTLEIAEADATPSECLSVLCCGICRTDAKMYFEGQRDLVLPRVMGHEVVLQDPATGRRFVPWPAHSCGHCRFCLEGRENLCEEIRVMGFHFDGGYQQNLPAESLTLFEIKSDLPSPLYTFAEPVGCVLHAYCRQHLSPGERMLIHGAGTLGLIAGFIARQQGLDITLLEKNQEKIDIVHTICHHHQIRLVKYLEEGEFDLCLNACADDTAFAVGLGKVRKGGRYLYFSGLTKNQNLLSNLINLIHYREILVEGSYGLSKKDMAPAMAFIQRHPDFFKSLIHRVIPPGETEAALQDVMGGTALKYILDFNEIPEKPITQAKVAVAVQGGPPCRASRPENHQCFRGSAADVPPDPRKKGKQSPPFLPPRERLQVASGANTLPAMDLSWLPAIPPIDPVLHAKARFQMDDKAKPLGAFGQIEDLAVRLCAMRHTLRPEMRRKAIFVFAGDHGITEEGVSAYPQEVTLQMINNFRTGKSAINVLCRQFGIELNVVDMGVNGVLAYDGLVEDRKIAQGTRNFALTEAMSIKEARQAIQAGMACVREALKKSPLDILGLGEMGIGNTSSAAMIIAAVTGDPLENIVGRGTGIDDTGLSHKLKVLKNAFAFHNPSNTDGLSLLAKVGGFEIAGMAGAALAAASARVPVVLDGVISTAAGLIAHSLDPRVADYLIIGHRSAEKGHAAACRHLGLLPVQDLAMRLGEGTGAAMAISLAECASRILLEMATFDEARISRHTGLK